MARFFLPWGCSWAGESLEAGTCTSALLRPSWLFHGEPVSWASLLELSEMTTIMSPTDESPAGQNNIQIHLHTHTRVSTNQGLAVWMLLFWCYIKQKNQMEAGRQKNRWSICDLAELQKGIWWLCHADHKQHIIWLSSSSQAYHIPDCPSVTCIRAQTPTNTHTDPYRMGLGRVPI